MKSNAFALLVAVLVACALISCASESSAPRVSLQIYQPPVLLLRAGQEIQTVEGRYIPQRDEVWHSDARFRQLEQENINLAAALAQRNRATTP